MKLKDQAKWEKVRAKGALRFVINAGLMQGSITGFLFILTFSYANSITISENPGLNLFTAITFLLAGLFWAVVMWILTEYRYSKAVSDKSTKISGEIK